MPPISVLIKPTSSQCNMRCGYCFYHKISDSRRVFSYGNMTKITADKLIKDALTLADNTAVHFAFQGGEPTLAGISFFRDFVESVKSYNTKANVTYSLQTNGTLIDEEWSMFLARVGFLVGISLDGEEQVNKVRCFASGQPTQDKVLEAIQLLINYKVEFNILSVVTRINCKEVEKSYTFLKKYSKYLQFTPYLPPKDVTKENDIYAMNSTLYGQFLIDLFDLYYKDYMENKYTSVRFFDNLVNLARGQMAEQCGMNGVCGIQFVIEANGNVYPCDFFAYDEYLMGNIMEKTLEELQNTVLPKRFLKESVCKDKACKKCAYWNMCRGGCKAYRGRLDFCESYKMFFETELPRIISM